MRFKHALLAIIVCSQPFMAPISHPKQTVSSHDGSTEETPLYLPVNEQQFPNMISKLRSALQHASTQNKLLQGIKLTTTDYWLPYQQGIRQGRPGIYFAAPHFSAWLINQHGFDPMLRLAGPLQYVIAVRRSDSHLFEINDLATKTVCTSATMDLSFLLVRDALKESLLPAKILQVEAVDREMKNNNRNCHAFALSEHLFLELAAQEPFRFIKLTHGMVFSNYSYLLHPSISSETKSALRNFLSGKTAKEILRPMYRLFSKEPIVLGAKPSDYPTKQMELLLPYWRTELEQLTIP